MRQFVLAACAIGIALLATGCNKDDTPLVESGSTGSAQTTGETGTTGDVEGGGTTGEVNLPGATGTAGTTTGSTPGTTGNPLEGGLQRNDNPSINANGEMIKNEGNNPPPPGRVWCDNCKGHLPKEDAVSQDGKTLCMACAEELKK